MELPEEVWAQVAAFCSLKVLLRGSATCSSIKRGMSVPTLPARREVRLAAERIIDEESIVSLLRGCPELRRLEACVHLRGKATVLGTEFARGDLAESLSILWLTLVTTGWLRRISTIWPCLIAIGNGAFSSLTSLRLELPSTPVGDRALLALCGDPGKPPPMPALAEIQLLTGWEVQSPAAIHVMIQRFNRLKDIAMPYSEGAARFRKAARADEHLRFNTRSPQILPPLRVSCGRCNQTIYDRLDRFVVGPPTQDHIAFELYTSQPPDLAATTSLAGSTTRRNCRRDCHSLVHQFIIARHGDFVDTRDFTWAIACGPTLAKIHPAEVMNALSGDLTLSSRLRSLVLRRRSERTPH